MDIANATDTKRVRVSTTRTGYGAKKSDFYVLRSGIRYHSEAIPVECVVSLTATNLVRDTPEALFRLPLRKTTYAWEQSFVHHEVTFNQVL